MYLCCIFSNVHTSDTADEFEVVKKIKKKCKILLYMTDTLFCNRIVFILNFSMLLSDKL